MDDAALVVISPLNGFVLGNGKILLTKKFVDGMMAYCDLWKVELIHVCEPASQAGDNLDNTEVDKSNSEFRTYCIELSEERLKAILPRRSVVLASVGEHFNSISRICQEANIPCVYVTEYNLRTRTEIANEYQRSKLHGAWSKLRQLQQEFRQRKALSLASGVQCNGLPTFEAYKSLTPSSLLYFDSRIDEQMLATDDQILSKVNRRYQADPIRLVFSGRINRIKGVDDLPIVAEHLRQMKIPFELSICGEGEYLAKLKTRNIEKKTRRLCKAEGYPGFPIGANTFRDR
jgi:glycosyltransferase involved in cell wall biosynthesis